MSTHCYDCEQPCRTVLAYEYVPDEFGMQQHTIEVSGCCGAEIYEVPEVVSAPLVAQGAP